MGNCSFKSVAISDAKESNSIRIMTNSGDIVKFEGPKIAGKVLGDFPGYGIFRQGRISSPLQDNEELRNGRIYFLLPLREDKLAQNNEQDDPNSELGAGRQSVSKSTLEMEGSGNLNKECSSEAEVLKMSNNLIPACTSKSTQESQNFANLNKEHPKETEPEPVRMSTSVEVLPPPQKGVWRVKFVIDTKQLAQILSEEVNTEALIEQMRLAVNTAAATPRQRGANWKPLLSSVLKNSADTKRKIGSPQPHTGNLIQTKTVTGNENSGV